jgi:neutral ceramidase
MLRVGFGTGVITPEVPVFLAGFGARTEPATSVHDALEARALHIVSDEGSLCLVVCDLLGMTPDVADTIRDAVGAAVELPRARVLTACTHTHTGPSVLRGSERLGWPTPPAYERTLVAGCVAAARAAATGAEPAELFHARRSLPAAVSMNRRGLPYDPTFAVLDARRPDGSTIGTLANVGIHPVALGAHCLAVSTDWVGPFRAGVAASTAGGVTLLQGALGDVNPAEPHHHDAQGDYTHAEAVGAAVAVAVVDVLGDLEPVTGSIGAAAARTIQAPVGPTPLAGLLSIEGDLPVELVEWALGSVRLLSVPGEAFHALGARLERSRAQHVLLAGLAPAWQGYLPLPFGDGYEESVSYGEEFVTAIRGALETDPL